MKSKPCQRGGTCQKWPQSDLFELAARESEAWVAKEIQICDVSDLVDP